MAHGGEPFGQKVDQAVLDIRLTYRPEVLDRLDRQISWLSKLFALIFGQMRELVRAVRALLDVWLDLLFQSLEAIRGFLLFRLYSIVIWRMYSTISMY